MLKSIYLLTLLTLMGCAQIKVLDGSEEETVVPDFKWKSEFYRDYDIPVGEVTFLELPERFPLDVSITCSKKKLYIGLVGEHRGGWVTSAYGKKIGSLIECKYNEDAKEIIIARYKVVGKKFPSERIRVDRKRVFINKKDRARVNKEQIFLNSNYFNPSEVSLISDSFILPLDSFVTSIYGARRVFNKKKFTKHLGTDFRAAIGTEIPATNSGRVVVSRDLFYTGYTVTIDHGLGIFTVYGHLSKLLVKEGEMVKRGQVLALSGNTGRTSGPHLHWGIKIHGDYIDGNSLIKSSEKLFR
jgi:murein DD-endopeptidase MepM/ murein hydrolase activator NlpD